MTVSIMKTILGRQYAAPASSAAICETTIKEITLVLNRGTQVARYENFFCEKILSPRINARDTGDCAKKNGRDEARP
ncbi:hypothetical protein ACWAT4_22485 [Bradyrhizobium manausense]